MGYGRALRQAHMNGHEDLNLELELHEQGLKATPRAIGTSLLPDSSVPTELYSSEYGHAQGYQPGLLSPDRAVIPDSPHGVSMRDFMTRKSLSPRGQDLATFLDNADMDWQIRQAEKSRMERQARSEAGSLAGDMATLESVSRRMSICAPPRPRTPKYDDRAAQDRSPTKTGRKALSLAPAGPAPACQLPIPPFSAPVPPVPPLPPLLPAPMVALPATPSSSGGTPITPAQATAATMPPLPAVPLASPAQSTPGREHITPEVASQLYLPDGHAINGGRATADHAADMGARMRKLSTTDDGRPESAVPIPPSSYAGSTIDDAESITSGTSSQQRMKRRTQKQPAMDLSELCGGDQARRGLMSVAELSSRPEMNFPKPGAMSDDAKVVVDENRPRKIRFG